MTSNGESKFRRQVSDKLRKRGWEIRGPNWGDWENHTWLFRCHLVAQDDGWHAWAFRAEPSGLNGLGARGRLCRKLSSQEAEIIIPPAPTWKLAVHYLLSKVHEIERAEAVAMRLTMEHRT